MLPPFTFVVVLLFAYVAVAWRSPPQPAPTLSHDGMRWLVYQAHPVRPHQVLALLGVLAVQLVGWVVVGSVLLSLVAARQAGQPVDVLWLAPLLGGVVALLATPWMARRAWTRLEADPTHLTLVHPWPWRRRRWPWAAVRDVIVADRGLVVQLRAGGDRRIDAPQASAEDLARVVAWLRATREAPAEPVVVPAPPPALERLRTAR